MSEPDRSAPTDEELGQLAEALRRHVADSRLSLDQFDERVARLYRARTRAEARAVLDGLPLLGALPTGPAVRGAGRRHGEADRIEPHWVATAEVFRDPSTGRVMRVWIDPTDGSRHYGQAG
jgi:hypothetical protein